MARRESAISVEIFHEYGLAHPKRPRCRRPRVEDTTGGRAHHHGRVHWRVEASSDHEPDPRSSESDTHLLGGELESVLQRQVAIQAPLESENCPEPDGARAGLIDQSAHHQAECQRCDHGQERVHALGAETEPLDSRQRHGRLQEPGDQPRQPAPAGSAGQGGPQRGREIEVTEWGGWPRGVGRESHRDGDEQKRGSRDHAQARVANPSAHVCCLRVAGGRFHCASIRYAKKKATVAR